jgi:hypothetical protein
MKIEEEVEEKTYSLDFKNDEFIFTDNVTQRTGVVSKLVAFSNSNQIDVDVKDQALAQLAYMGL